jgi:hypothetical protein
MERRKGLLHDAGIAVLILLCIPVGFLITVAGLQYHFPTPGIYIGYLFPAPPGVITLPILIAVGFVNGVCCYAIIFALVAVGARFSRQKDTK